MSNGALQAPFPYFGGKSKIAAEIWRRLGNPPNYVEPFFGSGAILLARPMDHRNGHWPTETVNDKDGYLANFWRAVQADPDTTARYADWPVNENDLHARHAWLVSQNVDLHGKLEGDPDFYDAKIAGWWVWGMCCWIGSGFCSGNGPWQVINGELVDTRQLVHLGNEGQGINRQLVHLGDEGRGIHRQLVHLGNEGRGVNRKRVELGNNGRAIQNLTSSIYDWFAALQARLSRVRVCSGDWSRVMGPSVTEKHGLTGVVLDPPYDASRQGGLYRVDDQSLYAQVRQWAIEHGDNPLYRIAYCGYEDGYQWPEGWTALAWKGPAGFDGQNQDSDNQNRHRETVWFSQYCLPTEQQIKMF